MTDRYPGYDVLAKRDSLGWNDRTRAAVDARLTLSANNDVLTERQRATLAVLADAIVPQPAGRPVVNTAAILLEKLGKDVGDGYRPAGLPPLVEAWRRGLDAMEAEAQAQFGTSFALLEPQPLDILLRAVERGDPAADWGGLDAVLFWRWRLIPDLVGAYYAHPSAWSAMGFGGPASPRGYVRLQADRRDPWEAQEADPSQYGE